jgi:type II secretory pathway pseudopilin PulG
MEAVVVVAIIGLLLSVILPALGESRRMGRLVVCSSNLRQIGAATGTYAHENNDLLWTFSWRAGEFRSEFPDLSNASDDLQAAADQAVAILRERADRPDIQRITGWIPHVMYSHLVLMDHLASRLPEPLVVCPEDRVRTGWSEDPSGFDTGRAAPYPDGWRAGENAFKRWPYSSSYELAPAAYDPGQSARTPSAILFQGREHLAYGLRLNDRDALRSGGPAFGGVRLSDVAFASGKAHVYESVGRHRGARRERFMAYADCQAPVLFFDGSVSLARTGDMLPGWNPLDREDPERTTGFWYAPQGWESGTASGATKDWMSAGYHRWTRGGIHGIDRPTRGASAATGTGSRR